mmetsp:Transcript_59491/g.134106  ORF Transcript_59491/g.134106 Transcript_59491/m.134106 type:complete len:266 (+) Transcript_59491:63-860(+)
MAMLTPLKIVNMGFYPKKAGGDATHSKGIMCSAGSHSGQYQGIILGLCGGDGSGVEGHRCAGVAQADVALALACGCRCRGSRSEETEDELTCLSIGLSMSRSSSDPSSLAITSSMHTGDNGSPLMHEADGPRQPVEHWVCPSSALVPDLPEEEDKVVERASSSSSHPQPLSALTPSSSSAVCLDSISPHPRSPLPPWRKPWSPVSTRSDKVSMVGDMSETSLDDSERQPAVVDTERSLAASSTESTGRASLSAVMASSMSTSSSI